MRYVEYNNDFIPESDSTQAFSFIHQFFLHPGSIQVKAHCVSEWKWNTKFAQSTKHVKLLKYRKRIMDNLFIFTICEKYLHGL